MPGIVGIISSNKSSKIENTRLEKMVDTMLYEPFYSSGTFVDSDLSVGVGWTCHRGSFSDCMPVWNEAENICLVFSGEHYAPSSEIDDLKQKGHEIEKNDARYLVHLYEQDKSTFFRKLNGTHSGLIIDKQENKLILFNDRLGLGRLYIHTNDQFIYFASEAKSLLKILPSTREYDLASLGEHLCCGSALQYRSIYKDISILPAASAWIVRNKQSVEKTTYFDKSEWENLQNCTLSTESYYEKLFETFKRVTPNYFAGDQEISLSITGGLDSRMVLAAAPRKPGELKCYSHSGMYRECVDGKIGRRIAKACGHSHQIIKVDEKFFKKFTDLSRKTVYYSDGCMDPLGSAGLYANEVARNIAPVRMTGNYGGEILRGLVVFRSYSGLKNLLGPELLEHYEQAQNTFKAERDKSTASFITFKQVPLHHYSRLSMERTQMTVRSPFLDNELVELAFQIPEDTALNQSLNYRLISDCNPKLDGFRTDRGLTNKPKLIPSKLWFFCREFLPRVEYVYDYGMPQWFVKIDRVLSPLHLDKHFLGNQKYYHFRRWYRHELADKVKEIALDSQTLDIPFLNRKRIEQAVLNHISGKENNTSKIHTILQLAFMKSELLNIQ